MEEVQCVVLCREVQCQWLDIVKFFVGIMLRKLLLLFLVSHYSYAYNIELDWSYVLSNPDFARQEREAYFGYTVGLITSSSSSW